MTVFSKFSFWPNRENYVRVTVNRFEKFGQKDKFFTLVIRVIFSILNYHCSFKVNNYYLFQLVFLSVSKLLLILNLFITAVCVLCWPNYDGQRTEVFTILFSNYWMMLSRIWRILQIKVGVNTLRDLQNSSNPTKAEFNNCFIIYSKYFPVFN